MGQSALGRDPSSPGRWLLHPAAGKARGDPKPNGGSRSLGIPTVNDRVIQQAIAQVLTPIIDPTFSESSHGFRPGRNAHGAVKQVKGFIEEGYRVAVDVDLSKFFDRVNHDILMSRLSRHIADKRLLKLIGRYLRAGVDIEGAVLCRHCWQTWCWTISTNSWNHAPCDLPVTPMISPFA